jgi:alpha-tubulin suppressor-like RCC1 family protein
MGRRTWGLAALLLALAGACYRPRLIDCVLACDAQGGCPGGMSCADGYCTRGPVCTTQVAAGARHTCAIRGGDVTCWGANTEGQLGTAGATGSGGAQLAPTPIDLGPGRKAKAIAAGGRHTCAIVADATGDGVACWGDNRFGQLGQSTGGRDLVPFESGATALSATPLAATPVALTAGLNHTCALFDDGGIRCWGDDRFGQLGLTHPPAGTPPGPHFPAVDLGGTRAVAVAAGAYHTCALLDGGPVGCWGWNDYGQLGDVAYPGGDVAPGLIAPVALSGGVRARAIAAGAFHSCAITTAGEVTCWGLNRAGQVGLPFDDSHPSAAPGTAIDLGRSRTALALGLGTSHSCAVLDDFTLRCPGSHIVKEQRCNDVAFDAQAFACTTVHNQSLDGVALGLGIGVLVLLSVLVAVATSNSNTQMTP